MFAEDRHQGIDDGPDPERGQCDHREFPPIRKLYGDDVARADAKLLQGRGRPRNQIAEFGVGQALRFGAIGAVGQQRQFAGRSGNRLLKELIEALVDPESTGAHRSCVSCGVELMFAHA